MTGGDGDDALLSVAGDDTLSGDAGADVFLGGVGNDTMTGGSGADVFLFDNDDGVDRVTDFVIADGDTLIFYGNSIESFADLTFSTDGSGDAVLGYGTGSSITFEGLTEAELNPTPGTAPGHILIV